MIEKNIIPWNPISVSCGILISAIDPLVQWNEKEANYGGNIMRAKLGGKWINLTTHGVQR